MKRTIIAVGTAAALGLAASAAHAVAYFGAGATFTHVGTAQEATTLEQAAGGAGHMLFAPYFNVQGSNATSISIVNTDVNNGKAVKVRFRGAANSDDLLDFTLLLSPGDVWTGVMTQAKDGRGQLSTLDKSCTLPAFGEGAAYTVANRLPSFLSGDALTRHMREGYIEVLNMADIPPGSDLYTGIKHVGGVPGGCGSAAVSALHNVTVLTDGAAAEAAGLFAPTGGLVGSWLIMNQKDYSSFSGGMTAIRAVDAEGKNAYGQIAFAPQINADYNATATGKAIDKLTSDPLFISGLNPLWFDLPDMSTPIVSAFDGKPLEQLAAMGLQHDKIMNEYVNDAKGTVPMSTDWVVSQPTRRYYAAVLYGAAASASFVYTTPGDCNPYTGALTASTIDGMPYACIGGLAVQTQDREENGTSTGAAWSPGASVVTCGEVFTLSFGDTSPLNAQATNAKVSPVAGKEGWGQIVAGQPLPLVGFAGTSALNKSSKIHYGMTLPHRWND